MKISRQVGTQSQILNVYAQDFSVSTGAGIANIPATTVSYTWFRNNHAGASTGVGVSTASMGAYTSGAWTQINSATALGWYQFCIPNDALLSGDCAAVLLRVSTGAFNMAPIPIEIELTKTNNQQYVSSQTIQANVIQAYGSAIVTSASGQFRVSTQAIDKGGYGVTTIAAAITTNANVIQAHGSAIVTSDAGILNVSTQTLTAAGNNITQIHGQPIITTAAGVMTIDLRSIWGSAAVTSGAGILNVSTQTLASPTVAGVNVTSINGSVPVTTSAGVLLVSTQAIPQFVTSSDARLVYLDASVSSRVTSSQVATSSQIIQGFYTEINTSYGAGTSTFAAMWKAAAANVSTITVGAVNVSAVAGSPIATSGAGILSVSVVQAYGSAIVTSAAGQLRVSTQAIDKGGYGVTTVAANITTNANLLQVYGSAVVTSAAGELRVSTQALPGLSGSVNVTSINGSVPVTTAAGVLLVSTQAIPSFAVSSDSRFANLDGSVSSRAAAGDAMALTAGERATLAGVVLTTTQAESFRASSAAGSMVQIMYEVLANLTEFSNSGTTRTLNSVTSGTGGVATYQYDSTTPSAITRIS